MSKIGRGTWMTQRKITEAREILRGAPDPDVRNEGLACLRKAKPKYLSNLISQDHPDRIAAVQYIESHS